VATGKREREEGKRLNQGADDTLSMVKQHLAWVYGLEDAQIEQLLASSAQSIGSNLEKAQTCLNNGELEMVASAAHALKGLLLNFGLTIPAAMAAKIETAVENGESESYEQLLAGIRKEVGGLLSVGRSG
jgi:HPt (histidine-containing phosphotransfer) domain-containing protein